MSWRFRPLVLHTNHLELFSHGASNRYGTHNTKTKMLWGSFPCKAQYFSTLGRNVVGIVFTSSSLTIATLATLWRPVVTCWVFQIELGCMLWRNCCSNLAKRVQYHTTSTNGAWNGPFANLSQQHPTGCNTSRHLATLWAKRAQYVAPNSVAISCVQMWRSFG